MEAMFQQLELTHKHLEIHEYIFSTVVTEALELVPLAVCFITDHHN